MTTIQQTTTTLTDLVELKFTEAPRRPPTSVVRAAHCGCFPGLQQPIRHELFVLRRTSRALTLPLTSTVCCAAASDHPVLRACSPRGSAHERELGVPGKVSLPKSPIYLGFRGHGRIRTCDLIRVMDAL